jgi:hypothetical protein
MKMMQGAFSWHCQTCRERAAHNEHLDKVGTGNRKNGTFTGNTLGEQGFLPVPGDDKKQTTGMRPPKFLNFAGSGNRPPP